MPEKLATIVIYPETDAADAERAMADLRAQGLNAHLHHVPAPDGSTEIHLSVFEFEVARALELLQYWAERAERGAAESPPEEENAAAEAEAPTEREPETLHCPRCSSSGVEVLRPAAWRVALLQGILSIPHIRHACRCMSCGNEWRQYLTPELERRFLGSHHG
jgi:hypothetical protein